MKNLTVPQKGPSPRVALVSSTRAVFGPMEAAFQEGVPEAQILNLLDETLVEDFRREGIYHPIPAIKLCKWPMIAQEAGVDGILVTCSTLSPCVDDLRPFVKIPIVKIDEPVIEEVVRIAEKIGLLATAENILLKSVEPLVMKKAQEFGRQDIRTRRFIKGDIWPLLQKDPANLLSGHSGCSHRSRTRIARPSSSLKFQSPRAGILRKRNCGIKSTPSTYAVQALRKILSNAE